MIIPTGPSMGELRRRRSPSRRPTASRLDHFEGETAGSSSEEGRDPGGGGAGSSAPLLLAGTSARRRSSALRKPCRVLPGTSAGQGGRAPRLPASPPRLAADRLAAPRLLGTMTAGRRSSASWPPRFFISESGCWPGGTSLGSSSHGGGERRPPVASGWAVPVGAAGPGADVGDDCLSLIDRPPGRGSSFRFLRARRRAARRAAPDGDGRTGAVLRDGESARVGAGQFRSPFRLDANGPPSARGLGCVANPPRPPQAPDAGGEAKSELVAFSRAPK